MADESLKDLILDQLGSEAGIVAKRMFGGYGLYQDAHFFGIVIKGSFYLLTDSESRTRYIERRMAPFTYEKAQRVVSMSYYEVPAEVLESRDQLREWTRNAIRISQARAGERSVRPKSARPQRPRSRKTPVAGRARSNSRN